jgi:hypothetical protein
MKKLVLLMLGVLGAAVVLFTFLPNRKQDNSRRAAIRHEDSARFCYPDCN